MDFEKQLNFKFDNSQGAEQSLAVKHFLEESGSGIDVFQVGNKKIKVRIMYRPENGYRDKEKESDILKISFIESESITPEEKTAVQSYIETNLG
jgi:hypothetical protein